jgi:hypothetical protein
MRYSALPRQTSVITVLPIPQQAVEVFDGDLGSTCERCSVCMTRSRPWKSAGSRRGSVSSRGGDPRRLAESGLGDPES